MVPGLSWLRRFKVHLQEDEEGTSRLDGLMTRLYNRFLSSRLLWVYLLVTSSHIVVQIMLQLFALSINLDAAALLSRVVSVSELNSTQNVFIQGWATGRNQYAGIDSAEQNNEVDTKANMGLVCDDEGNQCYWVQMGGGHGSMVESKDIFNLLLEIWANEGGTSNGSAVSSSSTTTMPTTYVVEVARTHPDDEEEDEEEEEEEENDTMLADVNQVNEDNRAINNIASAWTVTKADGTGVVVSGLARGGINQEIVISPQCAAVLVWPANVLNNTVREDITFAIFFVWMIGISLVALYKESIPHLLAAAFTHLVSTGWSAYQIAHTQSFKRTFHEEVITNACQGVTILPDFWGIRRNFEIAMLALNATSLVVELYLCWKLMDLFGWQTFKRVGANPKINRIYKLMLSMELVLQLDFFFLVAFFALWLDQLCNGVSAILAVHKKIYRPLYGVLVALLFPWILLGIRSVRRESVWQMSLFLGLSTVIVTAWAVSFLSANFCLTFMTWHFFAVVGSIALALTALTISLGIAACFQFGKGLTQMLNSSSSLEDDFTFEKTETQAPVAALKPSSIPTFSKAFPAMAAPSRAFTPRRGNTTTSSLPQRARDFVRSAMSTASWRKNDEESLTVRQ